MRKVDIDEYKSIVLNILIRIDEICRENHLRYYLMYGTLIGAIRHKGFIPWDDDVDIVMPREDYYRLMKIINENENNLSFISIDNNPDTIYPFGKICDTRTSLIEKNFKQVKGYGAFIDVFPWDYMPEDEKARKVYCRKCRRLITWITHSSRTSYNPGSSLKTRILRTVAFYYGRLLNTQKMIRKLDGMMANFDRKNGKTSYIGLPWDICAEEKFPAEMFEELIEVEFEGHLFFAPKEYDTILKKQYGEYMQFPPENERVFLHSLECYVIE